MIDAGAGGKFCLRNLLFLASLDDCPDNVHLWLYILLLIYLVVIIEFKITIHMLVLNPSKGFKHGFKNNSGTFHRNCHANLAADFFFSSLEQIIIGEGLQPRKPNSL